MRCSKKGMYKRNGMVLYVKREQLMEIKKPQFYTVVLFKLYMAIRYFEAVPNRSPGFHTGRAVVCATAYEMRKFSCT